MATDEELMALARQAVSARDVQAARALLAELERETRPDPARAVRLVARWLDAWAQGQPWQGAGATSQVVALLAPGLDHAALRDLSALGGNWLPATSSGSVPPGMHPVVHVAQAMGGDDELVRAALAWALGTQDAASGVEVVEYDGLDYGPEPGWTAPWDGDMDAEEEDDGDELQSPPARSMAQLLARWIGQRVRAAVVVPWFVDGTWGCDAIAAVAEAMPHDGIVHLAIPSGNEDPEAMAESLVQRLGRARVTVLR